MKRSFFPFFILFLSLSHVLTAGNTGKIFGRVTDKNSGEPLVGVNVIVVGQPLGASTDLNGEYYILNLPPAQYDLECSYIGYNTVNIKGIQVLSDQTTIVDIELSEQVMETDEEIVVVAERPMIQKDLTATKNVATAEEIKMLPVETYAGIMLTQAGVTLGADGAMHIRGGRSTEIAYQIDGVSVSNPFSTNGLATSVATNAIQEMTVESGSFNAEYGNAMSGIVNFTTKDGGSRYQTYLSVYSGDYISSHKDIFLNIDDINPTANLIAEGTFSGPLFKNSSDLTFFLSARYDKSEGYLYGVREHLPTDSANFEPKKHITQEKDEDKIITTITYTDDWYIERNGDNQIVPMNPRAGLNLLGKLKYRVSPSITLRLQTLANTSDYKLYSHAYKYNPDGIYNRKLFSTNNSLQWTHTLSPETFYEIRGAINTRQFDRFVYEDPTDPRYAPSNKIKGSPGGLTFLYGGQQNEHLHDKSITYFGKFDFTSQVDNRNLVKFGVEARVNKLDRDYSIVRYDRNIYKTPTQVYTGSGGYGKYVRYPQQASAYLQDKLEYRDVIINAGLRYDYFYSDADYAVDELQPDGKRAHAKPKHMLSPRLGVAFPISAEGNIHLSYGHFYQMPALANLYSNPDFSLPVSGTPRFGNANLNPEKTILYEIGLQQQLTSSIVLNVTGFYKDIRNLLAWQTITFDRLDGDRQTYRVRRNQDYGNVKGVTLTLEKRAVPGDKFAAKLDYTFQAAEGNDNDPSAFYYNSLSGQESIKEIIPLDWDQPHILAASVTLLPTDELTIGLIGRLSAGNPYTPRLIYSNYDSRPNSDRKPAESGVDLRASYRLQLGDYAYQIFLKVYNLFDTLNERYVYNDTGRAKYTFATRSIDEPESFKKHYGEPGVHTYDEYLVRPDYYRSPRSVRLGVSVEF
ncbi:MAG: TonB-dependent receptor [Calditrichaeota bacterium]|nr:MAG: TonB-dependent receptor [Calditrichota bacterium]